MREVIFQIPAGKSRTYTVNQPTRTITWPLIQKVPWWRRLLSRVPFWDGIRYRIRLRRSEL